MRKIQNNRCGVKLFTLRIPIVYIRYIPNRLSFRKTIEKAKRFAHHCVDFPLLFQLFSKKAHIRFTLVRASARYRFVYIIHVKTKARVCKSPKKYSPPRCGFTFVSRDYRGRWQWRRLKAKRACLANISKTKCKLTRRPFGVYITPRSRRS